MRARRQDGNGDGSGDGSGNGGWNGDWKNNDNGEGRGGVGELWYPPHPVIRKVEDQALSTRTRHHLFRQEVAAESRQQLRAQEPALARRCGNEGRTGHQGREGGNGDENRNGDGSGNGNEDEDGNDRKGRDGSENGSSENGNEKKKYNGGEKGPGHLRSGNRGVSEDARAGATPTNKQQP